MKRYFPNNIVLPNPVAGAIEKLLAYLWDDERVDFEQSTPERQSNHIFNALSVIKEWLQGGEEYVE